MRQFLSVLAVMTLASSTSLATSLTLKELREKWKKASTQMLCQWKGDAQCGDSDCATATIIFTVAKIKDRYYARFSDIYDDSPGLPEFAEVVKIWNAPFTTRLWNFTFQGIGESAAFSLTIQSTLQKDGLHEGKEGFLSGFTDTYWHTHKFTCTFTPAMVAVQGYSSPKDDL